MKMCILRLFWSHSFQTTLIHILVKEQVNLQLGHVKHIGDVNSSSCASHFHSNDNGSHSVRFGHVIITQRHIVWTNYLVGVERCPM